MSTGFTIDTETYTINGVQYTSGVVRTTDTDPVKAAMVSGVVDTTVDMAGQLATLNTSSVGATPAGGVTPPLARAIISTD